MFQSFLRTIEPVGILIPWAYFSQIPYFGKVRTFSCEVKICNQLCVDTLGITCALVLYGSTNWTQQAYTTNVEHRFVIQGDLEDIVINAA